MIDRLTVKNYGCIDDETFRLSPLHAFIGPNDSGKSTILRAVRTLVQFAADTFLRAKEKNWRPFDPDLEPARPYELRLGFHGDARGYALWNDKGALSEALLIDGKAVAILSGRGWNQPGLLSTNHDPETRHVRAMLMQGARMLRLDPDALRIPSSLIPESDKVRLRDERGLGLPGVYDSILSRGDQSFATISAKLRELFPSVSSLRLKAVSSSEKVLEVQLASGKRVTAEFMSEGLLYYLAFAAVPYLEPTSVLLVEEPENGLHPARIAEVVRHLRELSKSTQVLMATHSPLVINELEGHEVTVVTRTAREGTKGVLIKDTPDFESRSKVYALGELWLSYANGSDEAPLLKGGPRAQYRS